MALLYRLRLHLVEPAVVPAVSLLAESAVGFSMKTKGLRFHTGIKKRPPCLFLCFPHSSGWILLAERTTVSAPHRLSASAKCQSELLPALLIRDDIR